MDDAIETPSAGSTVGRGLIFKRLFIIAYVIAVAVAMIGWWWAFGWLSVRFAEWLLA